MLIFELCAIAIVVVIFLIKEWINIKKSKNQKIKDPSETPATKLDVGFYYFRVALFLTLFGFGFYVSTNSFYEEVWPRYDLYRNGLMTSGIVEDVSQREKIEGGRKHKRRITVYEHKISYLELEKNFEENELLLIGDRIQIYYSAKNPKNAVVARLNHPYKSLKEAVLTTDAFIFLSLVLLFGTFFYFTIKAGFKIPKTKKDLYSN